MMNGNKLPNIKRCREYHLYDYSGERFLDLYQDDGRAIMGHKPGKTMLPIKNSLEKGCWSPYPSIYENRLKKLMGAMFPHMKNVSFFANRERAQKSVPDSFKWKPLLGMDWGDTLSIEAPLPGINQTVIVLSTKELPPGDTISPVLLEGMIRNFHDYLVFEKKLETKVWNKFDGLTDWERKGPYLTYRWTEEAYDKIYDRALEQQVFLAPHFKTDSIIPAILSQSEVKTLLTLFKGENE